MEKAFFSKGAEGAVFIPVSSMAASDSSAECRDIRPTRTAFQSVLPNSGQKSTGTNSQRAFQRFLATRQFFGGGDVLFQESENLGGHRIPVCAGVGAESLVNIFRDVLDVKRGHRYLLWIV